MSARLVEGGALAETMLAETRRQVDWRGARGLRPPMLAIVLQGSDPGASAYARRQSLYAERAGVRTRLYPLRRDAGTAEAISLIEGLNADAAVDAILPLSPFAPGVDSARLACAVHPAKDVDGLHPDNAGRVAHGLEGFAPCTASAALALAVAIVGDVRGRDVAVVGASIRVGRPLAHLLLQAEATVTQAHAATRDLAAACRHAEVLFVAVGRPGLITQDHVRPGATVIDIGVNLVDAPERGPGAKAVVGDVDLASVREIAGYVTAVPDGVGPLTTAFLMANALKAACASRPH